MDEDEIVELFVQTQAVAFTSELARRRKSEEGEEEEKYTTLNINDLPDIMLLQIFNYLTPSDLVKTSQVCRYESKTKPYTRQHQSRRWAGAVMKV